MVSAVRMIVYGRVQGVGFRAFANSLARRLGVRGWVRNLSDGTVEILAESSPSTLARYEQSLRAGNGWCEVSSIDITPLTAQGYASFEVLA